jgi:hypothetical protein
MSESKTSWKVRPHGTLTEIDDGILTVTGTIEMPLMQLPRSMTLVRLADGRLVVFSAIALDEAGMKTIEEYGEPAWMVVPNDHHRLDAAAWKERYPKLRVVAPEGALKKVAEAVAVDTSAPRFGDPKVRFVTVPGTRAHEAALEVETGSGLTLVLNDVVANIRHAKGFGGWLLELMGFAGDEPHVPRPVALMMVDDKAALRKQLIEWAGLDSLRRILVSHGEPIEANPQQALRELARALGD